MLMGILLGMMIGSVLGAIAVTVLGGDRLAEVTIHELTVRPNDPQRFIDGLCGRPGMYQARPPADDDDEPTIPNAARLGFTPTPKK